MFISLTSITPSSDFSPVTNLLKSISFPVRELTKLTLLLLESTAVISKVILFRRLFVSSSLLINLIPYVPVIFKFGTVTSIYSLPTTIVSPFLL